MRGANKKILIIVVAAATVVAIVAGIVAFKAVEANQIAHEEHAVAVEVSAAGYDPSTSTPVPVRVEGSNLDGNIVSFEALVGADGYEETIQLMRGDYAITALGSPILADGGIFLVSEDVVEVHITEPAEDSAENASIDVSGSLSFDSVDPLNVTDEQIAAAKSALVEAGFDADETQSFADAATASRDAAVEQERQRQQLAANNAAAAEFRQRFAALNPTSDISGSMTQMEMNAYAANLYASYNALMDDVLAYLGEVLSDEDFAALQVEQDMWLVEREQAMNAAAAVNEGGTMYSLTKSSTGMDYDQSRIPVLINMIPT